MADYLTESRLAMWRALIALAHADGVVMPHELDFITRSSSAETISEEQKAILQADLETAQDVSALFTQITHSGDRKEFFAMARSLCWSDGDFDEQERHILDHLKGLDKDSQESLKESRTDIQEIDLNFWQWG